jgi:hypothetical protein
VVVVVAPRKQENKQQEQIHMSLEPVVLVLNGLRVLENTMEEAVELEDGKVEQHPQEEELVELEEEEMVVQQVEPNREMENQEKMELVAVAVVGVEAIIKVETEDQESSSSVM